MRIQLADTVAALFLVPLLLDAAPAAAQPQPPREERVTFAKGASSATVKGQIKGDDTLDYVVRAGAGQTISVTLKPSNRWNYFNVLPPGSGDIAMYAAQTGEPYSSMLPEDGDYKVRVYLVRAAARRNESSAYTLTIGVTGKALEPLPGAQDALVPGTKAHAKASITCVPMPYVETTAKQCDAFVTRGGVDGTATVEISLGTADDPKHKPYQDPARLVLTAFFAAGTWLFFHYDLHVFFSDRERAVAMITSYDPYDEIIFIALQILQVVFAPITGEASGFIGGFLYGPLLGTIYSTIGLTNGSWIVFLLAHIFGLPLVEHIVSSETLRKYDYVLEHKGVFIAFFLFLIPGIPKDFLCYILGLSHMRLWTFLIISTVGRLFGTIMLSSFGSFARNNQFIPLVALLDITSLFLIIAYFYRENVAGKDKGKSNEI